MLAAAGLTIRMVFLLRSVYAKHCAKHPQPNLVLSQCRIVLWSVQRAFCVRLDRTPAETWFESVWTNSFKCAEQIEKRRNGRFWNCQVKSQTLWGNWGRPNTQGNLQHNTALQSRTQHTAHPWETHTHRIKRLALIQSTCELFNRSLQDSLFYQPEPSTLYFTFKEYYQVK